MLNHEQSFNPFLYHVNLLYFDDTRLVDLKGLQIMTWWLRARIVESEEVAGAI